MGKRFLSDVSLKEEVSIVVLIRSCIKIKSGFIGCEAEALKYLKLFFHFEIREIVKNMTFMTALNDIIFTAANLMSQEKHS